MQGREWGEEEAQLLSRVHAPQYPAQHQEVTVPEGAVGVGGKEKKKIQGKKEHSLFSANRAMI